MGLKLHEGRSLAPDRDLTDREVREIEIAFKYEGYIARQKDEIDRALRNEMQRIPADLNYDDVRGLSFEVREKLKEIKPETIGQAGRISGVTPAAVSLLLIYLSKSKRMRA